MKTFRLSGTSTACYTVLIVLLALAFAGTRAARRTTPWISTAPTTTRRWRRRRPGRHPVHPRGLVPAAGYQRLTSTGTGGVTNANPLLTKGRGEAENSNVDMNYFMGICATHNVLVADFEEGASGSAPGLELPSTEVGVLR